MPQNKPDTVEAVKVRQYLQSVVALVVEQGLGKTRSSILVRQLTNHGGRSATTLDFETTHILVGNTVKLEKLVKILKITQSELREGVEVVRADWLSCCLKEGELVDLSPFRLERNEKDLSEPVKEEKRAVLENTCVDTEKETTVPKAENSSSGDGERSDLKLKAECSSGSKLPRKRKLVTDDDSDSDYVDSEDEEAEDFSSEGGESGKIHEISPHISPHKKGDKWICTKASSSKQNFNERITEKLEVLERIYKNTNDRWRALGYKKAISSIKNYHKKIETLEECQSLPFVGERLAKKVWEIIQTGHLQRLEHLDEKTRAIDLFCNLWGAGPKSAEIWVAKGLKTLQDLTEHGSLNRQQMIGLKYYDEFLERMSRREATEIGRIVTEAAHNIDPGLQCEVCGSYRRGRSTCGDVDVLVSHPDGISHQGVMTRLLESLKTSGFLTDDLTLMDNKNQRKCLGVCILPGEHEKHRRLDIIVVPYVEWTCALLYFTGSDYLNRSMRLLARKKGMHLSEHSLNTGVVREGQERISEGTPLPVSCEKDVFQYLGLDYLEPEDRDW